MNKNHKKTEAKRVNKIPLYPSSILSIFLSIYLCSITINRAYAVNKNLINAPIISSRCKNLLEKREQKIKLKEKIWALMYRNRRLKRTLHKRKKTAKEKLDANYTSLKIEYAFTVHKIQKLTEKIVKKGCPGIKF